jgi:hypothetical protein
MAFWPRRRPIQSTDAIFKSLSIDLRRSRKMRNGSQDNYQGNVSGAELERSNGITLADEEEHVLRCLGAALILQWNTLPAKLQRETLRQRRQHGRVVGDSCSESLIDSSQRDQPTFIGLLVFRGLGEISVDRLFA